MKYSTVLWDIDGTLLNTLDSLVSSYRYTIDKLALEERSDEEIASYIGPTPQTIFQTHFNMDKISAQKASDIFRENYKNKNLYNAKVYNGIYEVLETLKRSNINQAVATNKRQDYAIEICRYFKIDQYCNPIIGSDNQNTLTKKDIVKQCLEYLQVEASHRVVLIGDTNGDKTAAEQVGIDFIGVNYGFGFKNIDNYADSPSDILKFLA